MEKDSEQVEKEGKRLSRDREMEETEQRTRTFLEGKDDKDPSKIMWQKKSPLLHSAR